MRKRRKGRRGRRRRRKKKESNLSDSFVHVTVPKDDERRLASEFQGDPLGVAHSTAE